MGRKKGRVFKKAELTVLRVVLELLGRDGGAEEVLEVLEDVLLGRRKGARLRVGVELSIRHGWLEDALLSCKWVGDASARGGRVGKS